MAELHDIMGAILRDLAQARVTSDLYSREISKHYEKDSLLRLFPIPRTEINDVEIELKFAINEIELDESRNDNRNAQIDSTVEKFSEKLTETIFNDLIDSKVILDKQEWQDEIARLKTEKYSGLKQLVLTHLEKLIETQEFKDSLSVDVNKSRDQINTIVNNQIYSLESIIQLDEEFECLVQVKSSVSRGLKSTLEDLNEDLSFITESEEYKIEVDVTKEKLDSLPPEAISSIKIRTSIRNYTWSQVEENDGEIIRRLTPE